MRVLVPKAEPQAEAAGEDDDPHLLVRLAETGKNPR